MANRISRRTMLKAGISATAVAAAAHYPRAASAAGSTIRFLYTNDTHAHLVPFTENNASIGGVARRKALLDRVRSFGGNIVLLDAGDVFQGTLYFNLYDGLADVQFVNALGYDAMTLGNHEFDKGLDVLAAFLREARLPVVSANLAIDRSSPIAPHVAPWRVLERGGRNIGVIGLTTDETPILASPGPLVQFGDYYSGLQGSTDYLGGHGVPIRVGLTHIGANNDEALAAQLRGVSVIVGGHSHTRIDPTPRVVPGADGSPVLVVQAECWGKYLGLLDVEFDDNGLAKAYRGALLPIDAALPEDPGFLSMLQPFTEGVEAFGKRIVGNAAVLLNGDRAYVRTQETNLGDLIADLMLARTAHDHTEIAMLNSGGIRSSIPAGPVSVGQIIEVLPFGNVLYDLSITGAQVVEALENGVSQVEDGAGRFPQVGGIRFAFDANRPAGSRVSNVRVGSQAAGFSPIEPGRTYRIVTNDFMAGGGDGYAVFTRGSESLNSGLLLADVLMDYFTTTPSVSYAEDGRIEAIGRQVQILSSVSPANIIAIDDLWTPGEGLISLHRPVWAF